MTHNKTGGKKDHSSARNTYKRVFEYITYGGMPMATIEVHEDDFSDDVWDSSKTNWDNIRVTVCVGGSCRVTTLKRIVENNI